MASKWQLYLEDGDQARPDPRDHAAFAEWALAQAHDAQNDNAETREGAMIQLAIAHALVALTQRYP